MKSRDNFIQIAQIGKTVGLRGFLKLHLHTDFPEQFQNNKVFYLQNDKTITIEKYNKKRGIIKFVGFDDKEGASVLTNQFLYTTFEDSSKNCQLKKNEYFWYDMINVVVIEKDTTLGQVIDIQRFDPNDFLIVQTTKELRDKSLPKQFLIPYIDRYIINFDKDKKIIYTKDTLELLKNS